MNHMIETGMHTLSMVKARQGHPKQPAAQVRHHHPFGGTDQPVVPASDSHSDRVANIAATHGERRSTGPAVHNDHRPSRPTDEEMRCVSDLPTFAVDPGRRVTRSRPLTPNEAKTCSEAQL
jgi:hypothetical protein